MVELNKPAFHRELRYCIRCCIPETEEGTTFDELGICQGCRSSEEKMHINWSEREQELRRILDDAKANAGDNYDCIVPISGGKDSTFQLHVLVKVYGMKVLAVTFSHNWFSETGWYNLLNSLEKFNVDHIMFTPNRGLVNRVAKRSIYQIGDACWHCHAGVRAFPLQTAVLFNIPLLVYGEPAAEGHGGASYSKPSENDRAIFSNLSAKRDAKDMVNETLSKRDLYPFRLPTQEEFEQVGVRRLHLGNYIFWDDEKQTEFIRDTYGWLETEMEGTYKGYKSAECIMPGMHDFTNYLKRGYGRGTTHANADVRNGLLTREEGFALANRHDSERPEALDYLLGATGMTEDEFYRVMKSHRKEALMDVEMPVRSKEKPNAEKIQPLAEQWIERVGESQKHIYGSEESPDGESASSELDTFLNLSIGRISEGYQQKEFSPVEIVGMCIDQVERMDPSYRAWVNFDRQTLLEQARDLEVRLGLGQSCRLLEGIPVGVKDIFNTVGFPTQMGSPLWTGFTPGNDARAVFHIKRAGGFIAGKTESAELGVHALGRTLNPHDSLRNPGTSSSGSAVAVATGMVPIALATQTAASIVRPASFCGVYGCKPSFGVIPRTGVLKTTDSLDTVGFFTTHLEDLERAFDVLRVQGPNYPIAHAAFTDTVRQSKPSNRSWRVALVRTHTWDQANQFAQRSILDWAKQLSEVGDIEVIEVELPYEMEQAHKTHATVYERSLANYFEEEFKKSELISPIMNEMIQRGLSITTDQFHQSLKDQENLARLMDEFLRRYDVMISLSTAGEAPLLEEIESPDPGLMWTMTHLPVISAPVFTSQNGLPFGAQLVARRYNDPLLFKFARYLGSMDLIPEGPNPSFNAGDGPFV